LRRFFLKAKGWKELLTDLSFVDPFRIQSPFEQGFFNTGCDFRFARGGKAGQPYRETLSHLLSSFILRVRMAMYSLVL
jgi:hypothetical protein